MIKKLSSQILIFTLLLCNGYTTSILAENISNYSICSYNIQQPGKNLKTDIIIAFLLSHIHDVFKNENITLDPVDLNTIVITSITPLPDENFQIKLHLHTTTKQNYKAPYGIYDISLITDGTNIKITDIDEL